MPGAWDVQVPSPALAPFAAACARLELETAVLHEDLGAAIDRLMRENEATQVSVNCAFFSSLALLLFLHALSSLTQPLAYPLSLPRTLSLSLSLSLSLCLACHS